MRLSEFTNQLTNKQRLDEVNMSPSSLRSLASNINARAGMEFEMCVPKTSKNNPITQSFAEAIGKPVSDSSEYHNDNIKRPDHKNNFYLVEPDRSIKPKGLEFVSPAMPVAEMISDLDKVAKWATTNGCYTNESTGLHINISVDNWSSQKGRLDYVKLVLLSGDQHILEEFNRQGNDYCKNALVNIIKKSRQYMPKLFHEMKSGLNDLAHNIINIVSIEKYTSIHPKNGYVEFRAPGGDWLGIYQSNPEKIINAMLRYVVALDAAVDPEKYRNEYLKKLYAMTKPKSNNDPLAYFAQYAAGEIDFAELVSNTSAIRSRRNNKLVGDISKLTGVISPKLTGEVSQYLRGNVSKITGDVSNIKGDVSNIRGDVSNIRGNVSNIIGNVSNIEGVVHYYLEGDVSNIRGDVSKLIGDVSKIKGDVSDIEGDVSKLEGDVSNISGNVSKLEGDVGYIEGDVSNIKGDTSYLHGNVHNIEGDVSNIGRDVSNISGNVSKLEGDVSNISGNVSKLEGDVSNIEGDVSNISGMVTDYLEGDVSDIRGDVSDLTGNATGCKGDVTGLSGDIREVLKVS